MPLVPQIMSIKAHQELKEAKTAQRAKVDQARARFVEALKVDHANGFAYAEIARHLGITRGAINHYLEQG